MVNEFYEARRGKVWQVVARYGGVRSVFEWGLGQMNYSPGDGLAPIFLRTSGTGRGNE